jgi:uncharacterized protein (TIGR03000 family)
MRRSHLLVCSVPALVLAALVATPATAAAQVYYGPWYSYYGYNTPYAGTYFYGWPSYSGYPAYYGATPVSSVPPSSTYRSSASEMQQASTASSITVHVPADAEVWFGGKLTMQTGAERHFVSPPLQPGVPYFYAIRARWLENGQVVERTRQVPVRSGTQVSVSFNEEKVPMPESGRQDK